MILTLRLSLADLESLGRGSRDAIIQDSAGDTWRVTVERGSLHLVLTRSTSRPAEETRPARGGHAEAAR